MSTKVDQTKLNEILAKIKKRRTNSRSTKNDVLRIWEAKRTSNWRAVYKSRLYRKYSPEYCELLQCMEGVSL